LYQGLTKCDLATLEMLKWFGNPA